MNIFQAIINEKIQLVFHQMEKFLTNYAPRKNFTKIPKKYI